MSLTATYVAANQFTVAGDQTTVIVHGSRIRADCGVSGIKYLTVLTAVYTTLTTVTTIQSTLDSNLTDIWYGITPNETGSIPQHGHSNRYGDGGAIPDQPLWDDIRTPPGATVDAVNADLTSWTSVGDLVLWTFDSSGLIDELHFAVQVPHDYKLGSPLYPHIHWVPLTSSPSGNVVWKLEYTKAAVGDVFPSTTTLKLVDAAGSQNEHQVASWDAIPGFSKLSGMIYFRLYRDSADSDDTYEDGGNEVGLLELDFHYERDSLGSYGQFQKWGPGRGGSSTTTTSTTTTTSSSSTTTTTTP